MYLKYLLFLFIIIQYIYLISSENDNEDENDFTKVHLGTKGLTKERIRHFERLIKENEESQKIPELNVIRRKKPYFDSFPINGTIKNEYSNYSRNKDINENDSDSDTDTDIDDYNSKSDSELLTGVEIEIEPISSGISNEKTEIELNGEGEISDFINSNSMLSDENHMDNEENLENFSLNKDNNITSDSLSSDINKKQKNRKLSKFLDKLFEKKNKDKKNKKVKKNNKSTDKIKKKEEQKRKKEEQKRKKEEQKRKKEEKNQMKKLEKEKKRAEQELKKKNKKIEKQNKIDMKLKKEGKNKEKNKKLNEIDDDDNNKSFCSRKKKNLVQPKSFDNMEMIYSDQNSDNEDLSTRASDDEYVSITNQEIIDQPINLEHESIVNKPDELKSYDLDFNDDEPNYSSNDYNFKTERISSDDLLTDNESDYIESIEEPEDNRKYQFNDKEREMIFNEKAVEPLEHIHNLDDSSDNDDELVNHISSHGVEQFHDDNEEKQLISHSDEETEVSSMNNYEFSNNEEINHESYKDDNEYEPEDSKISSHIDDNGETDDEQNTDLNERKLLSHNEYDDNEENELPEDNESHKNKFSKFIDNMKKFFKKKPSISEIKCKGPSCFKKSKENKFKYTSDFIPRIYLLSRDVPKEHLHNLPEVSSKLRSESNRMVFAYNLIDTNLLPSCTLASNSRSFITKRWGEKMKKKLIKLRSEFDTLKERLSEMYHEGVLIDEIDLFYEEIDDLTIMLYLAAKEFPSKTRFSDIAKDILRFPEVVASPGQKLLSMFRNSKVMKCVGKNCERPIERDDDEKLIIKKLRKRMKFIKERYKGLSR